MGSTSVESWVSPNRENGLESLRRVSKVQYRGGVSRAFAPYVAYFLPTTSQRVVHVGSPLPCSSLFLIFSILFPFSFHMPLSFPALQFFFSPFSYFFSSVFK